MPAYVPASVVDREISSAMFSTNSWSRFST